MADDFLVASRNRRHDREAQLSVAHYFTDPVTVALGQIGREPAAEAPRFALPEGRRARTPVGDAMARRRSVRDFSGGRLALAELASLLRYGDSETAEVEAALGGGGTVPLRQRSAPSGGGLYPVELWTAALKVSGLDQGVYRYLPRGDALEAWRGGDRLEPLLRSCVDAAGGIDLGSCAAIVLLVAQPWRSMRKYGPRGMRFVLHEAGAISQNVHLAATALDIGTCDYSSYFDDETHRALDLDGVFRAVVHMILVGSLG